MSVIGDFIIQWDNTWRYDYWYRSKYNIAFNSPEHRELSPIDMKIQFEEDRVFNKENLKYKEDQEKFKDFEQTGNWLKYREPENSDDLFEALDVTDL